MLKRFLIGMFYFVSALTVLYLTIFTFEFVCDFPPKTHSQIAKEKQKEEALIYKTQVINLGSGPFEKHVRIHTVTIDSCEYFYAWIGQANGGGIFTHKGNCKFCKERNHESH